VSPVRIPEVKNKRPKQLSKEALQIAGLFFKKEGAY
jgi:hypothetical protein